MGEWKERWAAAECNCQDSLTTEMKKDKIDRGGDGGILRNRDRSKN